MKMKILLVMLLLGGSLFAQKQIKLDNSNDFEPQAGNWTIVGDIMFDRNFDIHNLGNHEPENTTKKRKKKNKKLQEMPMPIVFNPGTGILLNLNDAAKRDELKTKLEHGDIILDLEVMLPKGSNSGIYFQGRYELQLFDSWGVRNPKMSDMGGIYRNWEKEDSKDAFDGIPPLSNASKAPGLWQKLHVHFQAPRFNDAGEKIANAKFVLVTLNGVPIQTNVEVPHYTGGSLEKDEVAKGPLMIQGDHGPVAFRNINYQLLEPSGVSISSLVYKTFTGKFSGLEDLDHQSVVNNGEAKQIDVHAAGDEDNYGIVYKGTLNITENDEYTVSVGYTGGVRLSIDGVLVLEKNSVDDKGELSKTLTLKAGSHDFILTNVKTAEWRAPRLGFSIRSASTNPKVLNAYDSYPSNVNDISPIFVQPGAKPRLLRAFVDFNGNGKRLSHTIGVGTPNGLNFVYNLGSGNLVGVWRGDFVDATPMWHSRGNGSFKPMGAVQWTFMNQPIAQLSSLQEAFPDTGEAPDFVPKGYTLDESSGMPVFDYLYKTVKVEDRIMPDSSNTYLVHDISFSKTGMTNWYYKLASGKVRKMPEGSYAINDQQYYIDILSAQEPIIREVNGETELVLPVDGRNVKYAIIW